MVEQRKAAGRIIMGIDPGLASTGYGIIAVSGSRMRCIDYGVIQTEAGQVQAAHCL